MKMFRSSDQVRKICADEEFIRMYSTIPKEERFAIIMNAFLEPSFVPTMPQRAILEAFALFNPHKSRIEDWVHEMASRFIKYGGSYEEAYLMTENVLLSVMSARAAISGKRQLHSELCSDFTERTIVMKALVEPVLDMIKKVHSFAEQSDEDTTIE